MTLAAQQTLPRTDLRSPAKPRHAPRVHAIRLRNTWRLACGLLAAVIAAAPAFASPGTPLSYDDARHLLARTGFGPTDAEVRAFTGLTRAYAVDRLLAATRTNAVTALPAELDPFPPLALPGPNASVEQRMAFNREQVREGLLLRGWWVREMLATPSPLTERMTLFWHNHFVSAQPKVRLTRFMLTQNQTLRANALGNFGTLLHAIAKDPAMIVYLDGAQNRKGAPNENFAREVMELFTLGEGNYTEQDIKEAARAFTGWSIDRQRASFVYRRALHDDGIKTIFGHSGRYDGDDVLDLLLARPETAELVATKLWREFVSSQPDPAQVHAIAKRFRDARYDIRVALRELLVADAFYAAENRATLVKSPAELVVGTLRQLALAPGDTVPFAVAMAGMGQNLFSPPNVKGWPGGEVWINTNTLLARKQFLDRLTREDAPAPITVASTMASTADAGVDMAKAPRAALAVTGAQDADKLRAQRFARRVEQGLRSVRLDAMQWTAPLAGDSTAQRNTAAEHLLLATAPQRPMDPQAPPAQFLRATLLDPAYQLK